MASLTIDQRVALGINQAFIDRIGGVLFDRAQYWNQAGTPNRTDVNIQMQKRKRLAKSILGSSYVDSYKQIAAKFWLTLYTDDPAVLDSNGIPDTDTITSQFDPTFDYLAGYNTGDENETNINW